MSDRPQGKLGLPKISIERSPSKDLFQPSWRSGFTMMAGNAYFEAMPQKPLDLPMNVAKAFVKDMKPYFAEPNRD